MESVAYGGMDVDKKKIAMAGVAGYEPQARLQRVVPNNQSAIEQFFGELTEQYESVLACYEAGAWGGELVDLFNKVLKLLHCIGGDSDLPVLDENHAGFFELVAEPVDRSQTHAQLLSQLLPCLANRDGIAHCQLVRIVDDEVVGQRIDSRENFHHSDCVQRWVELIRKRLRDLAVGFKVRVQPLAKHPLCDAQIGCFGTRNDCRSSLNVVREKLQKATERDPRPVAVNRTELKDSTVFELVDNSGLTIVEDVDVRIHCSLFDDPVVLPKSNYFEMSENVTWCTVEQLFQYLAFFDE